MPATSDPDTPAASIESPPAAGENPPCSEGNAAAETLGLENIEGEDAPLTPTEIAAMYEDTEEDLRTKSPSAKTEMIEGDEAPLAPPLVAAMHEDMEKIAAPGIIEHPLSPAQVVGLNEDMEEKQRKNPPNIVAPIVNMSAEADVGNLNQNDIVQPQPNVASTSHLLEEEIGGEETNLGIGAPTPITQIGQVQNLPSRQNQAIPLRPTPRSMLPQEPSDHDVEAGLTPSVQMYHEVVATVVPNEPVYDAVQVQRSWWKNQKFTFSLILLVVVLVVALALSLSLNNSSSNPSQSDPMSKTFNSLAPSHISSTNPTLKPSPKSQVPISTSSNSSSSTSSQSNPTSKQSMNPTLKPSSPNELSDTPTSGPTPIMSLHSSNPSKLPSTSPVPSQSLRPSFLPSIPHSPRPSTYWNSLSWKIKGQTIYGEAAGDESGHILAFSGDGKSLAIGSPGLHTNEDRPGFVKVYDWNDTMSQWEQIGQTMMGANNGDLFGEYLGFSEDGKILAVGAPGYRRNDNRPGYVRVLYRDKDDTDLSWKQLDNDIIGDENGDEFGISVALSSDGMTLAVGSRMSNKNGKFSGHTKVYSKSIGSSWEQLGQEITGEEAQDNSGWYISLSADGETLAIGAVYNGGNGANSGHVRVYHMDGLYWKQLGPDIDGEPGGNMSKSAFSADGKTLAVGAYGNGSENGGGAGQVKVYCIMEGDEPNLIQLGQSIIGDAVDDRFGISVALSADGRILAVGADRNDANGNMAGQVRVYVWDEDGLRWKQLGQDILGNQRENAGYRVALSADGNTVAISYDRGQNKSGHVRVFNTDYISLSQQKSACVP